jgi:hypothetical protein
MYTTQTNGLGADIGAGTINPAALNSTCENIPLSAHIITFDAHLDQASELQLISAH